MCRSGRRIFLFMKWRYGSRQSQMAAARIAHQKSGRADCVCTVIDHRTPGKEENAMGSTRVFESGEEFGVCERRMQLW